MSKMPREVSNTGKLVALNGLGPVSAAVVRTQVTVPLQYAAQGLRKVCRSIDANWRVDRYGIGHDLRVSDRYSRLRAGSLSQSGGCQSLLPHCCWPRVRGPMIYPEAAGSAARG